jgi:hypothetical protein
MGVRAETFQALDDVRRTTRFDATVGRRALFDRYRCENVAGLFPELGVTAIVACEMPLLGG